MNLLVIAVTFVAAVFLTRAVEGLARRLQIFPKSSYRRRPEERVPLLGGVAVYLVTCASWVYAKQPWTTPLIVSTLPLLIMGVYDDRNEIRGRGKLLVQLLAASVWTSLLPLKSNLFVDLTGSVLVAFPLTVVFIVGVVNAFNFIDGLDGQAPTFAVICALALSAVPGAPFTSLFLAAATAGFLVRNFHPAKIYLGEVGSGILGFTLSALATALPLDTVFFSHFLAVLFLFSVPFSDLVSAVYRRRRRGLSIFTGDREHIHHRLTKLQFGPVRALTVTSSMVLGGALTFVLAFHLTSSSLRYLLFAQSGLILSVLFFGLYWLEKQMSQRLLGVSSQMILQHLAAFAPPPQGSTRQRGFILDLLPYFRELQGEGVLRIREFMHDLMAVMADFTASSEIRSLGAYSLLMIYFDKKDWTPEEIQQVSRRLYDLFEKHRVVRNLQPIPEGVSFLSREEVETILPESGEIKSPANLRVAS
ncbi:MAG: glycosyltransferase family 4 protein [Bdellovibrionales bacterium]